ncbi:hypothetical protein Prudu_021033, partial [Prunus dulcis]
MAELKLGYSVETHITSLGFVTEARALWLIVAMPPFATMMMSKNDWMLRSFPALTRLGTHITFSLINTKASWLLPFTYINLLPFTHRDAIFEQDILYVKMKHIENAAHNFPSAKLRALNKLIRNCIALEETKTEMHNSLFRDSYTLSRGSPSAP